ncbi:ribonuclease HII [Pseudokineococcus lusitanus]|uniref:Ribonuclease n=1 Tax=Pseudokineococcus lusitanus TaxID=763993 RepID=A0A3N1HN03_9ACTN|nr:ribonuclease HII [Pseudokineococcus lusitanus]ROP43742.1 RNase HII [Pseudokineococcus lusitanus]
MSPTDGGRPARPRGDAAAARGRAPSLRVERALLREGHLLVAGVDEVGRGALAGPVTVGVVVVDATTRTAPTGLRDSKLLLPEARRALVPRLRRWAVAGAVGHASAGEVDALGIVRALRLAGRRALAAPAVTAVTGGDGPALLLLDGNHDWLSTPVPRGAPRVDPWQVRTRIKADLSCAAVAAASVLAKVERDGLMTDLAVREDRYGWAVNKGYSAPEHAAALRRHGPCVHHRRSWRLPGVDGSAEVDVAAGDHGDAAPAVPAQGRGDADRADARRGADDPAASGRMGAVTPAGRPAPSAWERAE